MVTTICDKKPPVVTHLTRVSLSLIDCDFFNDLQKHGEVNSSHIRELHTKLVRRTERVTAMMDLLAAKGFTFDVRKQTVFAYSNQIEAQEVKQILRDAGFRDREFQIVLEYTRGWGML